MPKIVGAKLSYGPVWYAQGWFSVKMKMAGGGGHTKRFNFQISTVLKCPKELITFIVQEPLFLSKLHLEDNFVTFPLRIRRKLLMNPFGCTKFHFSLIFMQRYLSSQRCVWTITARPGAVIILKFDHFRLKYSARDDKVVVYDGT